MSSDDIAIAIISDLHAAQSPCGDTHLSGASKSNHSNKLDCPYLSLVDFISDNDIRADILLCPGDVGNKADRDGILLGWDCVYQIASKLDIEKIIATSGNHDLDSRQVASYDVKGFLQNITPYYPISIQALGPHASQAQLTSATDQYWSRNFTPIIAHDCAIFTVNSCAYHGYPNEMEMGRVSQYTINGILAEYSSIKSHGVKYNILLIHHNPHEHSELGLGRSDKIYEGYDLLNKLASTGDQWLVIHGHKHHPKISYASSSGSANMPVVLSSGSMSAKLHPELASETVNQIHILKFHPSEHPTFGLAGEIESYSWGKGRGWYTAKRGMGLPFRTGFGHKITNADLATIASSVTPPFMSWNALLQAVPLLKYLTPDDLAHAIDKSNINVSYDQFGNPSQASPP